MQVDEPQNCSVPLKPIRVFYFVFSKPEKQKMNKRIQLNKQNRHIAYYVPVSLLFILGKSVHLGY